MRFEILRDKVRKAEFKAERMKTEIRIKKFQPKGMPEYRTYLDYSESVKAESISPVSALTAMLSPVSIQSDHSFYIFHRLPGR